MDELAALLAKLEISVERKYLSAIIKALDTNESGAVEFEEFKNFIIYDPYKWLTSEASVRFECKSHIYVYWSNVFNLN